ncbi:helix-turn-helix domain-containing protein [Kitasatospora purpeofusca]|uniref:helix-turn-helix domain-containing protein n=1 Tax=Kitasatospora purpeofusca TaxID=67352 RepID=UPI002258AAB9|nr:GAF domain-containing protein [Kitasatospora purpeofusca]MCX4752363.1 helix-turn-helix domain-containing protein [Kitasatospora purpeofusca]WSR31939.1 helix-turn-helix domain-containing protein [Kitasatospora purpeofusca]WSR39966.1 helix-turn-helix domain-containing protein [Kitasatospora purpeofusca]
MNDLHAGSAPALRRLLDLLASGAATEDFADVLADARRRGAPADVLGEIDDATWQALRVHRTLRQHRRREAELTALFDTAGDLAASRDLDAVLQAIVRRARMLLGTDTAYLTLPDEAAGDTYMRVTDGSVSVLFQTLRLSLGDGLGGLVAQRARPYATPDYRSDDRFHHTDVIDAGVVEEGLVAIIGVPLLLGGRVIGVLFAADRSPRAFSPDEVALLCTLAAHAAIALDTAKALADTRAALAELNSANELIRAHSAAVQRAERGHDRLTDLVLRGAEVPDVAAAVAALLGGGIAVLDAEGEPLAGRAAAPGAGPAETVAASRAEGRAVRHGGAWVCAVLAGQEQLGTLVLRGRPDLDDADRRLFERAGVVTALLLLLRRSVAETENRVRGELLADLLTAPDRDPAGLTARGRRLGVDLGRPHLVLVAEPGRGGGGGGAGSSGSGAGGVGSAAGAAGGPAAVRSRLAGAAGRYLFGARGISAEHGGAVVLLVPDGGGGGAETPAGGGGRTGDGDPVGAGDPVAARAPLDAAGGGAGGGSTTGGSAGGGAAGDVAQRAAEQAAERLARLAGFPVTVGAGRPAVGPVALAGAYAEGLRCVRALRVLGRDGEGASAGSLGFLGVLLGDGHDVSGFVGATLGPLLDYDARRGTELVRTLRAYFDCGGSLTRAKDELHVHVNTVVQRLDRVEVLLGRDWNGPERALELQLALRLQLLSGA